MARAQNIRSAGFVILAVMLLQFLLAAVFLTDFMVDVLGLTVTPQSYTRRELIQLSAWFGLALGVVLNGYLLLHIMRRGAILERSAKAARGAFYQLMDARFNEWGLTPSERDVALMLVKGYSNGEIAGLFGKAEGTVKAQSNAVYRKAEVSGRVQLVSSFIEDMLGEQLVTLPDREPDAVQPPSSLQA